jgi:hypothetical protein
MWPINFALATSHGFPHNIKMASRKRKTKFEQVQLKAEPGWYVRITLPHGEQIQMSGFETEARARDWIATKAADWLKNYRGGRYV